jgi:signal transduction histidine kinase
LRATLARIPDPSAVLENLFARAPVAFQIYDASGRSLVVNDAFRELFGSEPPPEYNVLKDEIAARNGVLTLIQRAFAGETVSVPPLWYDPRELTQVQVRDGRRVAMQSTFIPLSDENGAVTHVAIVFKDMTAELVQREQLEEERELLAAIVDQVGEGIVMSDEHGILRLANRAARELGVRPGSTLGALTGDPTSPLAAALRGEAASAVLHHAAPDGQERALAAAAVPLLKPDGKRRGAVITFRDETDRQRHEQEAQKTALFRERFIGILGHDLRSPLSAVIAGAGIIARDQGASPQVKDAAVRIRKSAARMTRMIGELLDFTQARLAGGISVQPQNCDVHEVARVAVEEAQAAAPERRIRLTQEGDTSGAFDADRVAQLFSNLLQNAATYAPAEEPIEVAVRGLPGHVEVAVSNGGPQIEDGVVATLFEPFKRGAAMGESKGLGLGLFIVQQIARAHGGDVEVETAPGRTTFRATLRR